MQDVAENALNGEPSLEPVAYEGPFESDSVRHFAANYDGPEDVLFPGCVPITMTLEQFESFEGGVEYWSRERETAWILCDGGPDHEGPGGYLPSLVTRISQERGSTIRCWGALRIATLDSDGKSLESMNPDQSIYLHPGVRTPSGASTVVGRDPRPDVVLEVDHTTDVRRNKLGVYARWGYPEIWVETPDAPSPSRPRGVRPGLRIYVLRGDAYVERHESNALPTWRAVEIHRALNEPVPSVATIEQLVRVGRVLGDAEGTGPMDDAQIGGYMRRSHAVGQRAGLLQGRHAGVLQGRRDGLASAAEAILRGRGLALPDGFAAKLATVLVAPDVLVAAAQNCTSSEDFWERLPSGQ